MMRFEIVVLVWPFIAVALALGLVFLAQAVTDRREERRHPAE